MKATQRGFTLIEVMITVAIIAILVGVALPSYNQYTTRAKRTAAQAVMHQAASRQENYVLNARSYYPPGTASTSSTALAPLGVTVPAEVAASYTVKVTSNNGATPPTWEVEATPQGGQASADAKCGILTLTSTGSKTAAGGGVDCWK